MIKAYKKTHIYLDLHRISCEWFPQIFYFAFLYNLSICSLSCHHDSEPFSATLPTFLLKKIRYLLMYAPSFINLLLVTFSIIILSCFCFFFFLPLILNDIPDIPQLLKTVIYFLSFYFGLPRCVFSTKNNIHIFRCLFNFWPR